MCSPEANLGKEPRQAFVVQLWEAAEEWRRRSPNSLRVHHCGGRDSANGGNSSGRRVKASRLSLRHLPSVR
jgi:hypothetical protein